MKQIYGEFKVDITTPLVEMKPRVFWIRPSRKIEEEELAVHIKTLSGKEYPIPMHEWKIMEHHKPKATRKQICLKGADAVTIHKSQGMTIDCLRVALKQSFAPGMAYVALSRATDPTGLQVEDFDIRKFNAHPKAIEFWKLMQTYDKDTDIQIDTRPPSPKSIVVTEEKSDSRRNGSIAETI